MGYEEYVCMVVCFHAYSLLVNLINIFCFLIWNCFHIFAKRFKETGMDSQIFQLVLLEDARNFIRFLPQVAKEKVYYNIRKVQSGFKDKDLFKKLEDSDIWEFRTLYKGSAYRLFAFWDTGTESLVVATHGISKKMQKTPKKEIAKAEAIMKRYFELKKR